MRVLGIDPGAKRLGYAAVEGDSDTGFHIWDSGVIVMEQGKDEKWGVYRRRLIEYYADFDEYYPLDKIDVVVFETQPPLGMSGVQQQLAKTVRDVLQTVCQRASYVEWVEFAPVTIKKNVTGNHRATKVGVRNGVLQVFPHLASRKKELTDVSEESDALAIALVGLGYKFGTAA